MKYILVLLFVSLVTLAANGCAMFTAWKSIPPPGGCDQCHTVPISANWKVSYRAADISDERGRLPFQTSEYNQQIPGKQERPQDSKLVEERACFDCHRSPGPEHRQHKGHFHH